ncbi:MAG TPA: hypothetical protein VNF92_00175 [Gemmatimonadaceae bacterium]|nr:hypothetical protein [Gemmatimonadaceae bacterium]
MTSADFLDRELLERLYLAHGFADPDRLARARIGGLSPAAREVRENCLHAPAFDRAFARDHGLRALASIMGAPGAAVQLAAAVDSVRAAELARFPFAEVVHALGGTVRHRAEPEEAWERTLRRATA